MENIPISDMRSFALAGHTSSGKTALADALLYNLGVNDRIGSVDNGSSMSDFMDEEKSRKITTFAKPFGAVYKGAGGRKSGMIFVDTPGYMDFYGQVVAGLRAVDTVLVAVDAASGVQVGTRHVWKDSGKNALARAIVITGLDKENTDFQKVLGEVQSAFGDGCVPVTLPLSDLSGVVDVLGSGDVPPDTAGQAEECKSKLIELAAETDDTLIEKFLGGEELSADEIASGLRSAVAGGGLVPVFVCVGPKDVGISELLESMVRLFPAPSDREQRDAEGNEISTAEDAPFAGIVWRTANDAFVGQLAFIRVLEIGRAHV